MADQRTERGGTFGPPTTGVERPGPSSPERTAVEPGWKGGGGFAVLRPRALWGLLREAASAWTRDKASRLGAALAYYSIFSLAPLLVVAIAVAGLVFGREAAAGHLADQIQDVVGPAGAKAVEEMLARASDPASGILAMAISAAVLLLGAAGLFRQLQDALNTVWGVEPGPGQGLWNTVKSRLVSFALVLGAGLLLLASLAATTVLSALAGLLGQGETSATDQAVQVLVSFGVLTFLFAMVFRLLPDAQVAWGDIWLGAAVTALLFTVGNFLLGLYLGHSSVASAYGAAGSLVVLLVWVYYSAQIFLFGAELTKVYADRYGSRVVPAAGGAGRRVP